MEKKISRLSKFKPEYCQMLIEHMASGLGYQCFSAVINVNIDTLYQWEKDHQIFSDAKKEAFAKNKLFWEKTALDGLWDIKEYDEKGKLTFQKSLNTTLFIFNMKNRFPDEWRDRVEVKQATQHSVDNQDAMLLADLMKELIALKKE